MKSKYIALLTGILSIFAVCGAVGCKGQDGESASDTSIESSIDSSGGEAKPQAPLTVPQPTLNADYSITWESVEGASAYVVNVNGEDLPIKNTTCYVQPFTAVGVYQVKIKALRGTEATAYSQVLEYAVYSIEIPVSAQYDIIGAKTCYGGQAYTFEIVPKDDTYDFSKMSVYANGEKVTMKGNQGTVENLSQNVALTVEGLTPLSVYQVTKSQGEGYTIVGKDYAVAGKEYSFQVALQDGFTNCTPTVKVNGSTLQAVNGVYTLKRVTGNVKIDVSGVTFSGTVAQELFLTTTWGGAVEMADGYATRSGISMTLPVNWLKRLLGTGYTHLTFEAKTNGTVTDGIVVTSGATTLREATREDISGGYVFRIDLSNLEEYDLTLQMQNGLAESLSIGNVRAYQYTDTWKKSSPLAYVCEEDGQIVVDTHGCGENVEIYKTNAVRVLGGVNATLTNEDNEPIYFSVATPDVVIATDMEYYATVCEETANSAIRLIVLKDEGDNRPIVSFEQSKAYVKQGSPFVQITVQSQETSSIEYVYGNDDLSLRAQSLVYKTTQFACELVDEGYKNNPFQLYSKAADIGAVIELQFVEGSFENEFYTSKAWSNVNGGVKAMEDGQLSVSDSWQLNLSASWLRKLYEAGYRTLEFDVKLLNVPYFQWYNTSSPTEGYFQTDVNGVVHVTVEISATEIVFRGKLQDGTDYNDPTSISAFSVLIYNVEIN